MDNICRDRRKHASPNAAQKIRLLCGALRYTVAEMQFILVNVYKRSLSVIDLRPIDPEIYYKIGSLMYCTAIVNDVFFGGIKLCTVLFM